MYKRDRHRLSPQSYKELISPSSMSLIGEDEEMDGPDEDDEDDAEAPNAEGNGLRSITCLQNGHDLLVRSHLHHSVSGVEVIRVIQKRHSRVPALDVLIYALSMEVMFTGKESYALALLIV